MIKDTSYQKQYRQLKNLEKEMKYIDNCKDPEERMAHETKLRKLTERYKNVEVYE